MVASRYALIHYIKTSNGSPGNYDCAADCCTPTDSSKFFTTKKVHLGAVGDYSQNINIWHDPATGTIQFVNYALAAASDENSNALGGNFMLYTLTGIVGGHTCTGNPVSATFKL